MWRTLRAGLIGAWVAISALGANLATPAQAAAPGPLRPSNAQGPLGNELLSDEETLTRWANVVMRSPIRSRPSGKAPRVARLRYETEDGPLEVYLVLESRVDRVGRTWLRVRVPMRPNGRKGWVLRKALGPLNIVRTKLKIDRRTLRATLNNAGHQVWSARVGVGGKSAPTPAGRFWIRTRLRVKAPGSPYGPYAFGTGAYSLLSDWPGGGVVGVHGTNQPGLIPGRPSHGCIRVTNSNIRRLVKLMPIGTPVQIV